MRCRFQYSTITQAEDAIEESTSLSCASVVRGTLSILKKVRELTQIFSNGRIRIRLKGRYHYHWAKSKAIQPRGRFDFTIRFAFSSNSSSSTTMSPDILYIPDRDERPEPSPSMRIWFGWLGLAASIQRYPGISFLFFHLCIDS